MINNLYYDSLSSIYIGTYHPKANWRKKCGTVDGFSKPSTSGISASQTLRSRVSLGSSMWKEKATLVRTRLWFMFSCVAGDRLRNAWVWNATLIYLCHVSEKRLVVTCNIDLSVPCFWEVLRRLLLYDISVNGSVKYVYVMYLSILEGFNITTIICSTSVLQRFLLQVAFPN